MSCKRLATVWWCGNTATRVRRLLLAEPIVELAEKGSEHIALYVPQRLATKLQIGSEVKLNIVALRSQLPCRVWRFDPATTGSGWPGDTTTRTNDWWSSDWYLTSDRPRTRYGKASGWEVTCGGPAVGIIP